MSKKDKAFYLFSQGKVASSPEVKALGLSSATRYGYFSRWNHSGKPDHVPSRKGTKGTDTNKVLASSLPEGESMGAYKPDIPERGKVSMEEVKQEEQPLVEEESKQEEQALIEEGEQDKPDITSQPVLEIGKRDEIPVDGGGDHEQQGIPERVLGNGIMVSVNLSIKTIAAYQIAHTMNPKLSLGDYLDQVSEDFWQGRGQDLVMAKVGGNNGR